MTPFDRSRSPRDLVPAIDRMFAISAGKIRSLESTWSPEAGAPVFTVGGRYQSRGWTEWTQGFQFGRGDVPYATGSVIHVDGGLAIPRL